MQGGVEGLESTAISRSIANRGTGGRKPTHNQPVANGTLEFVTQIGRSVKRPYITAFSNVHKHNLYSGYLFLQLTQETGPTDLKDL